MLIEKKISWKKLLLITVTVSRQTDGLVLPLSSQKLGSQFNLQNLLPRRPVINMGYQHSKQEFIYLNYPLVQFK